MAPYFTCSLPVFSATALVSLTVTVCCLCVLHGEDDGEMTMQWPICLLLLHAFRPSVCLLSVCQCVCQLQNTMSVVTTHRCPSATHRKQAQAFGSDVGRVFLFFARKSKERHLFLVVFQLQPITDQLSDTCSARLCFCHAHFYLSLLLLSLCLSLFFLAGVVTVWLKQIRCPPPVSID